jgi:hypothetical protein
MFNFEPMRKYLLFLLSLLFMVPMQAQFFQKGGKQNYLVSIEDASFTTSKPEKGAHLTAKYVHDTIHQIDTWFGFTYGDIQRTFYYWNGELITVTEIQRLYNGNDPSINLDSIKPSFNARYIFENGALTNIQQKGTYSFSEGSQDRASMEAMYLGFSNQYNLRLDEVRADKKNRKKN